MELKPAAISDFDNEDRALKRTRPSVDDEHWGKFLEEASALTEESYRTIRSF